MPYQDRHMPGDPDLSFSEADGDVGGSPAGQHTVALLLAAALLAAATLGALFALLHAH